MRYKAKALPCPPLAQELSVCGKWASQRWSAKPFSVIFAVDISDPLHPAAV
jgi:hypothetical protein